MHYVYMLQSKSCEGQRYVALRLTLNDGSPNITPESLPTLPNTFLGDLWPTSHSRMREKPRPSSVI